MTDYIKIQFGTTFYQISFERIKTIDELYYESQSRALKILFNDGERIEGITTTDTVQEIIAVMDSPS